MSGAASKGGRKNVIPGRGGRKLPKYLERDEAQALLEVPNTNVPTGLRNRCAMELMYRCGLRVGEVCSIHVRDVKWKEGTIHLRPEITKGKVEAYVVVPDATMAGLERWKATRANLDVEKPPELLISLKGKPLSRTYVYAVVRRAGAKAGIKQRCHPHLLRHSWATHAAADGVPLPEIQAQLRHVDIQTTMIYTHTSLHERKKRLRGRGGPEWA